MSKKQLPQRLFRSNNFVSCYQPGNSAGSRAMRVAREHTDVLFNIESTLVMLHRDDPEVDDQDADTILRAAIEGQTLSEEKLQDTVDALEIVRKLDGRLSDNDWLDCLRTLRDSVKRHSSLRPGDRRYLDFVDDYIPEVPED
jgi:hypothetical protein